MGYTLCSVHYTPLPYDGPLEEKEIDFIQAFSADDGSFYLDEDCLNQEIEALKELGRGKEVPDELVNFLRQTLEKDPTLSFVFA